MISHLQGNGVWRHVIEVAFGTGLIGASTHFDLVSWLMHIDLKSWVEIGTLLGGLGIALNGVAGIGNMLLKWLHHFEARRHSKKPAMPTKAKK